MNGPPATTKHSPKLALRCSLLSLDFGQRRNALSLIISPSLKLSLRCDALPLIVSPSLELFVLSPPKNQSRPPSSVLLPSPVLYPASKRAWPLRLPACRPDCPSDPRITPLTCHRSPCSLCCCPVSVLLCRCLQRRPTAGGRWPACARAGLKGKRKTKAGPGLA